uniref:Vps8 domain-containing protein n=1 Tax=Caenorhabditis elegans TaxID=6239 RepID=A3QMB4_CAEEL|nr:Vps8 domain-containing protein [Caenorhabditis elegans]CAM36346.1 Vps8 domain-containing protein [Caenorhabditis elegans]|eukprot:NP_001023060.1 related to yeast Vacuolar Protein Sorting factor [Caenorhabditis elegans]
MSTSGSLEKEDWLDLGDLNNAPTFSLEDALNDTENLSDPFLDEQFAVDGEFGSVSNLTESTAHSPDSHSLTYKLDSAFVIQPHQRRKSVPCSETRDGSESSCTFDAQSELHHM